jgi:hypothetical protein
MIQRLDGLVARCAAAVAVEDLAHRRHAKLRTPAVAFMGLALSGVRRLVVRTSTNDGRAYSREAMSVTDAMSFLVRAPVNVSWMVIHPSVDAAEWHAIVAVLARNRCHGFLRLLHLPRGLAMNATDAAALLMATSGLAHLRSLQCTGALVEAVLASDCGGLRRLALPDCSDIEEVDFKMLRQLRRVGPTANARNPVIDLSHLQRLVRVDEYFASKCDRLRDLRLPPSVRYIGGSFLESCTSMTAALDLSHLTRLRSVGGQFAMNSAISDVRLPPAVTFIPDDFVVRCMNFVGKLDFSNLSQLQSIGNDFAADSSVRELSLPASVAIIGENFLRGCKSMTAALDLSHLTLLRNIRDDFGHDSSVRGVMLPPSIRSIADGFLFRCHSLPAVLDLTHLTQLRTVGLNFARRGSVRDVRLPPNLKICRTDWRKTVVSSAARAVT